MNYFIPGPAIDPEIQSMVNNFRNILCP